MFEKVLIANIENGARFETYIIPGEPGSGEIQLNGAAARLGEPGDVLTIMVFGYVPVEDAAGVDVADLADDAFPLLDEALGADQLDADAQLG